MPQAIQLHVRFVFALPPSTLTALRFPSPLQFVGKLARLRAISIAAAGCGRPSCWLSMIWKLASRRAKANPIIGFLTDCVSCSSSGYSSFQSSRTSFVPLSIAERFRKHDHQFVKPATSGQVLSRAKVLLRVYSQWFRKSKLAKSPLQDNKSAAKKRNGVDRQLLSLSAAIHQTCACVRLFVVQHLLPVHVDVCINILISPWCHTSWVMQRCVTCCRCEPELPRNQSCKLQRDRLIG